MNENLWLTSRKPAMMLAYLAGRISERKKRLLCVACCRTVPHLVADKQVVELLETAEQFADEVVGLSPLELALTPLIRPSYPARPQTGIIISLGAALRYDVEAVEIVGYVARESIDSATTVASVRDAFIRSYTAQADLVRDLIGNPFRPPRPTAQFPSSIVQLAEAQYAGQEVGFALHDAFLDADMPELAEHFQPGTKHPKGCWLIDLVLGKN